MTLQAGTGIRDVTPVKPMQLMGYPHVRRFSTDVHDPLLAHALCLKNEDTALVQVSVDIIAITPSMAKELRSAIAERTSVDQKNVFVSCTHTHSGPWAIEMFNWQEDDPSYAGLDSEYLRLLKTGIVEAAADAFQALRPAELAWTTGDATGVSGNRLSDDGPTDSEIAILAVRDAVSKDLLSVATVYGAHPSILRENSTLVSADYPYYTRLQVREEFGQDLTYLFHNGPCGDQSFRRYLKSPTFKEAERLGRLLGTRICKGLSALSDADFSDEVDLASEITSVTLPRKTLPSVPEAEKAHEEYRAAYEKLKHENAPYGALRTAEVAMFGAEWAVASAHLQATGKLEELLKDYRQAEVQVLKIHNCYLAGFPCEIFAEYGLAVKAKAPAAFTVSLVNGEMQGYIVTPEIERQGSYEANNSLFQAASGSMLVDAVVDLTSRMKQRNS